MKLYALSIALALLVTAPATAAPTAPQATFCNSGGKAVIRLFCTPQHRPPPVPPGPNARKKPIIRN